MIPPWWTELSDGELLARLMQRGMPQPDAESWVHYRESIGAAEMITDMIGAE